MANQGVSFVVPVRNGARWLEAVFAAILAQGGDRQLELLAVEDGSTDGSSDMLARLAGQDARIRVFRGEARGAAAAINLGVREARHPIVCQVDQDVVIGPGWTDTLCAALDEPGVAAAQGYYETDRDASLWARVMGRDLEYRYSRISTTHVDHVCTGNSAYRVDALRAVGGFDESFGYGYDNDMSYRLVGAGYQLAFCPTAKSQHRWRESVGGYVRQQYGMGYGRLDLVGKHRRRYRGDDVSRIWMMLHAPLMLLALLVLAGAGALATAGRPWQLPALFSGALVGLLALERLYVGVRATRQFHDPAGLAFVPAHLLRDLAWSAALVVWGVRRLFRLPRRPTDSM